VDRLDFHTNPVNREQLRRIKSRLESSGRRQSRSVRLAFGSNAISLRAPLLWLGGALLVAAALVTPTVRVNGVAVQGSRILALEDRSGSMNEGGKQDELTLQKAQLGRSLSEGESTICGFGVAAAGGDSEVPPTNCTVVAADANLLHVLLHELPARRGADTVYVFSDFRPETTTWDCNDDAGLSEFRQLIRSTGVRLYLSTVDMLPSPGLLAIARDSGGALLGAATAVDSTQVRHSFCGTDQ
jgi:hypothetical protein